MPNIDCNLFSINKLTKDMNCVAKFFNSHCEFQDLCSRKMIGSAKECDGLCILEEDLSIKNKQAYTSLSDSISGFEDKIMLWHNRLGHPCFVYLKKLFSSLFVNKDAHFFHCDTC